MIGHVVKSCIKFIINSDYRFMILSRKTPIYDSMDDKSFLIRKYHSELNKSLSLEIPKTFAEKMQWLKLYNRKEIYTTMVDKFSVKKYVADRIGEEYIIPTLGVWDKIESIDFDSLPDQFVLKCTHDSGGLVICRDKSKLQKSDLDDKIASRLKHNFYLVGREWPYKNVVPRIIAEQYLEDSNTRELCDYKFYCFGGIPRYCQVILNRSTSETVDFFDMNWKHQDFTGLGLPLKPFSKITINRPLNFEKMKKFAGLLSEKTPFLRVDFYEVNGKLYFGELTFYPASGFGEFYPSEWNNTLGDLIDLPEK